MYKKTKLSNGLNIITSPMPGMASVTLGIWIGIGGRYESEKQSGISHLVEHMLFKGTKDMSTKELKQSIEGIGGAFNGFTSDEVTCYLVKVPSKYVELGVDVLADMVLNAKCDEKDLAKEKFVVCEEIKMYRDQPADHVLDVLSKIMWPGDPLGRSLTGTMTIVKSLTRKEIVKFRDDNYHPGNMAVVAAGKVNPEKLTGYVKKRLGSAAGKRNPSLKSSSSVQKSPRIKICSGDTNQTHIAFGFHTKEKSVKERFAMKLMNVMLGGNMSSRLFEELREKHGLCYDVASAYKRHSDKGEMQIHAGVDNSKAARSVAAILDEVRRIRDLGVTEEELFRAKEYTKGQFLLGMEGTSTRMMWLGDRFMVHKNIPEVKKILENLDSIGVKDIEKACADTFSSSSVNLAMISKISDKEKSSIKKELHKL
ncbi:MAG: pitrilysin family protein [Candidatus Aadella gelida]|nr:pitrilysin family protein [Candidatus Aadella gelida]